MTTDTTDATLLRRLHALFPASSGRRLKRWLAEGRVHVNDRVIRDGRESIGAGDRVSLAQHPEPLFPAALRLIHEDADILVIDKPPGLLTIATPSERTRTAYRLLWEYLAAARPPRRPFVVHRLDRETSGLLVVAKSAAAKRKLQAQFLARSVERIYAAVVEGLVPAESGTLESALVQDRGLRVRTGRLGHRGSRGQGAAARRAITHYRVRERRRSATLLELALGTGRRRQIRLQLAELGHPIVGDADYGSRRDPLRRLCLHATRLGFRHPVSGTPVYFESPIPPEFRRVGR